MKKIILLIYTLSVKMGQKKHHFFKATRIKIQSIKMNHNWA